MTQGLVIDCFAGGGGASTGIEAALNRPCDIAVNHDPLAIAMHKANHPATYHVTEDIFAADLKSLVGGRHVDVMWASPDCTHFSRAKGDKPRESGIRMLPWAVHHHAKDIRPDVIFMENVAEIQKWGPLGDDGKPIKEREGETYREFVDAMGELGYTFECRELSACDFGAPTTRRRWYAVLRRDGAKTKWPSQTHGGGMLYQPYVPASECIDFEDVGESVYTRRRKLAPATMRRLKAGIDKFVVQNPVKRGSTIPWIMKFYKTGIGQSVTEPLHTVTTSPGHFALVTAVMDGDEIADIHMRMLKPEELKLAQGFPKEYIIDRYADGTPVPAKQQVRMIGNSVVPVMAEKLVAANVA